MTESEIRAICEAIKAKAKSTAHVDQGSLKKSINYTIIRGIVTFRELFYGQWNDNSKLEQYANEMMPFGVEWRIIYTNLGGDEVEVGKTKQGRTSRKNSLAKAMRVSSANINRLIAIAKNDGKEKDKRATKKR